jgi:hypothetical protein
VARPLKASPWRRRLHLLRHRALAIRRLVLQPCAPHGSARQDACPRRRQGIPLPGHSLRPESCCATSPPPPAAPGALRLGRDDVDRLLGMVHTSSIRPRPRSPWRWHEASASERTPSVRTALTGDLQTELNRRCVEGDAQVPPEGPGDLRDKLNRRRAGRDVCISLEKTRERCGGLGQDSAAVAPRAPGDARF